MAGETEHEVTELGQFRPREVAVRRAGRRPGRLHHRRDQGLSDVHIGDTITDATDPADDALPGYQEPQADGLLRPLPGRRTTEFEDLRDGARRSSRSTTPASPIEPETSPTPSGFGFRCGFLGMLHMEIIQQRLERESNLDLVQTAPNVTYEILTRKGETLHIDNPTRIPDAGEIEEFREPVARVNFLAARPSTIGAIMQLCEDRRGTYLKTEYLTPDARDPRLRAAAGRDDLRPLRQAQERHPRLRHDGLRGHRLPSRPTWSGSTSWWTASGSMPCRSSSTATTPTAAAGGWSRSSRGRSTGTSSRSRSRPPSAAGSSPARRSRPLRKNVTAKCYGGDITRKRKLLEKQKEGKKRMKQVGNVEIPQEAFLAVLDDSDE